MSLKWDIRGGILVKDLLVVSPRGADSSSRCKLTGGKGRRADRGRKDPARGDAERSGEHFGGVSD